jgi:hypothetical protein
MGTGYVPGNILSILYKVEQNMQLPLSMQNFVVAYFLC